MSVIQHRLGIFPEFMDEVVMSFDMNNDDKRRAGGPDVSNIFTEQQRADIIKAFIQVMMFIVLVCAMLIYSCF